MNSQATRPVASATHSQSSNSILDTIEMGSVRIREIAETASASGLFRDMPPARAEMIMLIAQARGIHPIDALMQFDVIDTGSGGLRLAMKAEAMLAYLQRDGWMTELVSDIDDDTKQTYKMSHPVLHPKPKDYTLTMARLDERGVSMRLDKSKSTWDNQARAYSKIVMCKKETYAMHGASMLRARLISAMTRALRPGLLNGVYTPEEVRDMDDLMTVTAHSDEKPAALVITPASAASSPAPETTPKQETSTAAASTHAPTALERCQNDPINGKDAGRVLKELRALCISSEGVVEKDCLAALLPRCIERVKADPAKEADVLKWMTNFWYASAPGIHELCPGLSPLLAQLGCPPLSAPKSEDDVDGDAEQER